MHIFEYLNDPSVSIEQQQVPNFPNFAMTDYPSQGKSRPKNIVCLSSCHSHMSYYTCLSKSTCATRTVIIQGFDSSVMSRPVMSRHVPNILALSAKSRDFTIQE